MSNLQAKRKEPGGWNFSATNETIKESFQKNLCWYIHINNKWTHNKNILSNAIFIFLFTLFRNNSKLNICYFNLKFYQNNELNLSFNNLSFSWSVMKLNLLKYESILNYGSYNYFFQNINILRFWIIDHMRWHLRQKHKY